MKQAKVYGLIIYAKGEEIPTSIMFKALVARDCDRVDAHLGFHKREEGNVKWGRYKYVFVSPSYYQMFKTSIKKLVGREDHFAAICTMNKEEFKELKKEHADQKTGIKVMKICTTLFSLCGEDI